MSRYSQTYQWDITKKYPIIEIPEALPGERWAPITEKVVPDVLPYYAITTFGRVWHRFKNAFMTSAWDGPGYRIVILRTTNGTKTCRIHRLMMLTFRYYPGCEEMYVNHKDGVKTANFLEYPMLDPATGQYYLYDNLEWMTPSENVIDALEMGLKPYNTGKGKLDEPTVRLICDELMAGTLTNRQISDMYGVTLAMVENIRYGRSWKWVTKDYEFPEKRTVTADIIRLVCKDIQDGNLALTEISQKWKVSLDTVKGIKYRRIWTEVSKDFVF